tara:strand:- start:26129 stop:26299 length:171 start_codon:yes stop_codon:yes gene_type:complete
MSYLIVYKSDYVSVEQEREFQTIDNAIHTINYTEPYWSLMQNDEITIIDENGEVAK